MLSKSFMSDLVYLVPLRQYLTRIRKPSEGAYKTNKTKNANSEEKAEPSGHACELHIGTYARSTMCLTRETLSTTN